MDKQSLERIMPERQLLTTAWELVKVYCDYGPTAPEERTQQLLSELQLLYDGGQSEAQKCLARGLSRAMMDYFTAKASH